MGELTFKPAGAAMAALVAGLAPGAAHLAGSIERDHAGELAAAAATFEPAVPLGEEPVQTAQTGLFE